MSTDSVQTGPDRDAMISLVRETWPDAVVATIDGAVFFSLDESHWPNFATIVWSDEFDMGNPADLGRPDAYRVNFPLTPEEYRRRLGDVQDPEYATPDRLLPHPVYASQRWAGILNPSDASVRDVVLPLIGASHDRLAARRKRRQPRATKVKPARTT